MKQRYYSLDVFRGATVALMILVNNPGSWANLFSPLAHAPWHGCTPTDLVFPFFLFAVGNAMAFVMPRMETAGTAFFLKKVITRTVLIFAIGLFLNWAPFIKWSGDSLVLKYWIDPANASSGIRIFGVLQRIALCYFFAALLIYFFKIRGSFLFTTILLLGYWMMCLLFNPTDPYSLTGWFGTAIDKQLLGEVHMYKGEGLAFDPEGLMSTIPAIAQVVFGYFAGNYIQQKEKNYEMLTNLFVAGSVLIFTGFCWDLSFPINKKIWTSSYVLYTTGLAIVVLSILIYLIEFKKVKGAWSRFFDVFGKNPLFIFVLSGLLPRILGLLRWVDQVNLQGEKTYTSALPWFYDQVCKPVSNNLKVGSLLYALCLVSIMWIIVWAMDKKKWYVKV
ncbi:MAG: acyltransferase family protein [Chitinophagaceae bacterium]